MKPCQTAGCFDYATRTVSKNTRSKRVCRRCADELIAVFGWQFVAGPATRSEKGAGPLGGKPVVPGPAT